MEEWRHIRFSVSGKSTSYSGLDRTSVRPVGLTDSENQKPVRVSIKGDKKLNMTISRKDVARLMLDIVDDEKYY
jgi:hypothetical protein